MHIGNVVWCVHQSESSVPTSHTAARFNQSSVCQDVYVRLNLARRGDKLCLSTDKKGPSKNAVLPEKVIRHHASKTHSFGGEVIIAYSL